MVRVPVRIAALCGVIFFGFTAVPAMADDAAELLAKHKAFVGYSFLDGSIASLVLDGTITNIKKSVPEVTNTVHEVHRGIAERTTETDLGSKLDNSSGFTGSLYWEIQSPNGFINPVVGDRQKYSVAWDLLFNEATALMHAELMGTKQLEGTSYPVVRLTAAAATAIDVYVDPKTGAYKRAVIDPGGPDEDTLDILAYGDAGSGKHVISKFKRPESNYVHEWTKIMANVPVSNEALHPPVGTSPWKFGAGKPFPIQYKDGDYGRGIYISATVNGVPGRFKLDTGAYSILLTQAFAQKAHVKHTGSTVAQGFGPKQVHPNLDLIGTFAVGDNVMTDVKTTSADTDLGENTDGLLGFEFLAGAIVTLDLDNQQMSLAAPNTPVDKSKGLNVLVDLAGGQPHVPMIMNGKTQVDALLDSGDEFNVIFAKDLASKYGVSMMIDPDPNRYINSHIVVSGVGGNDVVECGTLDALALGPIVYQNTNACTTTSMSGRDVNVGIDFLHNFNIVFDYPEALLIMTPRKL
ncbi:MAG: retroviral-like aspartic protease family protein [Candidatus Baltobacteraceae bacterium]